MCFYIPLRAVSEFTPLCVIFTRTRSSRRRSCGRRISRRSRPGRRTWKPAPATANLLTHLHAPLLSSQLLLRPRCHHLRVTCWTACQVRTPPVRFTHAHVGCSFQIFESNKWDALYAKDAGLQEKVTHVKINGGQSCILGIFIWHLWWMTQLMLAGRALARSHSAAQSPSLISACAMKEAHTKG